MRTLLLLLIAGAAFAQTPLPSPSNGGAGGGGGAGTVTSVATTGPVTGGTITTSGTIACPTCVTSAASLTSTAIVTGAGSQGSQTPSSAATLDASGNMVVNSLATGTSAPTCTAGTAGVFCAKEGTAPTGEADAALLYPNSTATAWKTKLNNGSEDELCQVTLANCSSSGATVTRGAFPDVPACSTSIFQYLATDSPYTAHCNGSSSLQWFWKDYPVVPAATGLASCTAVNSADTATVGGMVTIKALNSGNMTGCLVAVPSAPYTEKICFHMANTDSGSNPWVGVYWADGTTNTADIQVVRIYGQAVSNNIFQMFRATDYAGGGFAAETLTGQTYGRLTQAPLQCWILADDNTNRTVSRVVSEGPLGATELMFSVARATPFTPTHIGIAVNGVSGAVDHAVATFYTFGN